MLRAGFYRGAMASFLLAAELCLPLHGRSVAIAGVERRASGATRPMTGSLAAIGTNGPLDFPWEKSLRRFAFRVLKNIRRWSIRVTRLVRRSAQYWLGWLTTALFLLVFGAGASVVSRRWFWLWWREGWDSASRYLLSGGVVFFRLLRDRRLGQWARVPLALALFYGMFRRDLLPDGVAVVGWLDDLAVMGVASRWFVRVCPDELVQRHAVYVQERTGRSSAASRP